MSSLTLAIDIEAIAPCGDRVLVRQDTAPEFVGTIKVPDNARVPGTIGTVLATGQDVKGFVQGDRVMLARYSGHQIEGHPDVLLMREEDVLARIKT